MPVFALPGSKMCPVGAYRHLAENVKADPSHPAFAVRRRGRLVSISQGNLQEKIKFLTRKIGLDPTHYSSHSLRRGGASWASKCGCSADQIKAFGDWRSDCYTVYIENSLESRSLVAAKMVSHIQTRQVREADPQWK